MKLLAAAGISLSLVATAAAADPVQWTLNNVAFDDGGAASGSFVYDADSNTYSQVNIVSTAGSTLPGATYIAPLSSVPSNSQSLFAMTAGGAVAGEYILGLFTTTARTNAGGTLTINPGNAESRCGNTPCTTTPPPIRAIAGGTMTGTAVVAAVPTMTEWATILFGLILAGGAALCIQRRRQIF